MILNCNEELLELKQFPTPDKPQAIVVATICDEQSKRQGIGVAEGFGNKEQYQPQKLIDEATRDALNKARQGYANSERKQAKNKFNEDEPKQSQQDQKVWTHNPAAGSISESQLNALRKMSVERNQSLEKITKDMYDALPEELSSEQAQPLFEMFKNMRNKP